MLHQEGKKGLVILARFALAVACLAAVSCGGDPGILARVDEGAYSRLLSENRRQVVYVDFWATWCDPCRAEMPGLVQLAAKYSTQGLKLITISADEPEQEAAVRQFVAQQKISSYIKRAENNERFINAIDPQWSGALPAGFLYGRDGRKLRSFIGEVEPAALEAAVKSAL